MNFVDSSVDLVRRAVRQIGKKPLAKRAGVAHGVLRRIEDSDFSPHVRKLRLLESASRVVLDVPEDVQ